MPRAKLFKEEEVLAKAMLLFWKKGYHATSMQDLVDYLGIHRASLYATFGDKKSLFDRALDCYRTSNNEGLQKFLESPENIKETIRMVFRKVVEDDLADPDNKGCLIANSTTELLPQDPELQEVLRKHKEYVVNVFYDFLLTGVENGEISEEKDMKTMAGLLYTLLTGLRVIGKTRPDPIETQATVDAVLSLLD